jgi:hypothetical protein
MLYGKFTSANGKEKDYIKVRAIVRGVKRHCMFQQQLTREGSFGYYSNNQFNLQIVKYSMRSCMCPVPCKINK